MSWLSSILYGLVSGLAEVLPVSASAHRVIMQSLLGEGKDHVLLTFLLHVGTLAALFYCCNSQIVRLSRARQQAAIPKRRRKRPLDTRSLLDLRVLRTTLVPIILAFCLYNRVAGVEKNLVAVSAFLFLNGIVLYIPQYLPGSNKDSRSFSPVDSLLMGLGAALSVIPGFSCVGTAVSIASVRGADKKFSLDMALLMCIAVTAGLIAMDVVAITSAGLAGVTFALFFKCLLSGAAAFCGTMLGIRLLRVLISEQGISVFSFYCWGLALFTFIFYLTAA